MAEEPSVFHDVYDKFKETHHYTEILLILQFTVIQLYHVMQPEGERADFSTSFFDKVLPPSGFHEVT